jgi:hypothetical protein
MRDFKLIAAVLALALAGCAQRPAPAPARFQPSASIQELMLTIVDPSADALWDSVSSETGPNGVEEHQPRTEDEWRAVRRHALLLIEAGNLLMIEGRQVTHGDKALEDAHVPGILDARQVRQKIDADHAAFSTRALALHAAGTEALAAIDARNAQRLLAAGERIDHACEGCHAQYWYPDAEQPAWPAPLRPK